MNKFNIMKAVKIWLNLTFVILVTGKSLIRSNPDGNSETETAESSNEGKENDLLSVRRPASIIIPPKLEDLTWPPANHIPPNLIIMPEHRTWPPSHPFPANWKPPTLHPYIQPPFTQSPTSDRPALGWETTTQPPTTSTPAAPTTAAPTKAAPTTAAPTTAAPTTAASTTETPTTAASTTETPTATLPGWEATTLTPTTLPPLTPLPTTQLPADFGWTSTPKPAPTQPPCKVQEPEKPPKDSYQIIEWLANIIDHRLRSVPQLSAYQINKITKNFAHIVHSELAKTRDSTS